MSTSTENAKTRVALRDNASIAAALSKAWSILDKNENGYVEREEYVCFLMRIVKFIVPHMKREEARLAAENDWLEDSGGADCMSFKQFCDGMFELTDLWCPGDEAEEYAHFLESIVTRTQVAMHSGNKGRKTIVFPSRKYAFVHESSSDSGNHWTAEVVNAMATNPNPGNAPGTWHETVSFDLPKETPAVPIEYRLATLDELYLNEEDSQVTPPYEIHHEQNVSQFWKQLNETAFEEATHKTVETRHISMQRRVNATNKSPNERARKNFRKLLTAVNRGVGELTSVKQVLLERHLILYGSDKKTCKHSQHNTLDEERPSPPNVGNMGVIDPSVVIMDPYDSLDDVLASVKEQSIWVVGKIGAGTEILAEKLAHERGLTLISPADIAAKSVNVALVAQTAEDRDEDDANISEDSKPNPLVSFGMTLLSGKKLDTYAMEAYLSSQIVQHEKAGQGYVLEGYPSTEDALARLQAVMDDAGVSSRFKPDTIVHLEATDDDLARKRAGSVVNIENGKVSLNTDRTAIIAEVNAKIEKLKKNIQAKRGEGEEVDEELIAELEEELNGIEVPTHAAMMGELPIRLPADNYTRALESLSAMELPKLDRHGPGRTIHVSAMQSTHDIVAETILRLEEAPAPFGRSGRPYRAVPIPLPDDVAAVEDEDRKRSFLLFGSVEGEVAADDETVVCNRLLGKVLAVVPRRFSPWGFNICPVTAVDDKEYVKGDPSCAAMYKGCVYVMASAEKLKTFLINPLPYVTAKPETQNKMKVVLVSPTLGGGEIGAAWASKTYGIVHINAQEIIERKLAASGSSSLDSEIKSALTAGAALSENLLTDMIMEQVNIAEDDTACNGWILTGCALNESQALLLVDAGLAPDNVILFSPPDADGEEILQSRQIPIVSFDEVETRFSTSPEFASYRERAPAVKNAFTAAGFRVSEMPCSGSMKDLIGWVRQLTDQLYLGEDIPSDALPEPVMGNTKGYCPVSLAAKGTLVPGSDDFTVQFRGKQYKLCSTKAQEQFRADPSSYLPTEDRADDLVKPFIVILGSTGSNTPWLLEQLSKQFDLSVIDVGRTAAYQEAVVSATSTNDDGDVIVEAVSPETVAKIIDEEFTASRGALLYGDPNILNEDVMNAVFSLQLHPSLVVPLEINGELAADRMINAPGAFKFVPPSPNEDVTEDGTSSPPTRAELAEMRQEQWDTELQRLVDDANVSQESCTALAAQLEEAGVLVEPAVPADVSKILLCQRVATKLGAHFGFLSSILSSASVIDDSNDVTRLLYAGYNRLSRFGPYCPVSLFSNKQRIHSAEFPAIYNNLVYLCSSSAARDKFVAEPAKFIRQPSPLPAVPVSCAIIGPPKSGKSTLSNLVAKKHSMVLLNPSNVLEWARFQPDLSVAEVIRSDLMTGNVVSPSVFVQALTRRVHCKDCQLQGYVLDGFPSTAEEATLMTACDLVVPDLVFELKVTIKSIMKRASNDEQKTKAALLQGSLESADDGSKTQAIVQRWNEWQANENFIVTRFKQSYHNLKILWSDGNGGQSSVSKFALVTRASKFLLAGRRALRAYTFAKWAGRPSPIYGLAINKEKIETNLGHMMNYCPVTWVDSDRLVATDVHAHVEGGVELFGKFYICGGKNALLKLLTDPARYLSGGKPLPAMLPCVVPYGSFLGQPGDNLTLELQGYCPVKYKNGNGLRDWSSLVEADPVLLAKYDGKVYGFATVVERNCFMEEPWNYVDQVLPVKLPPKGKALKLSELRNGGVHGVLAVVEQSLSDALQHALIALGNTGRIRHPSMSVEETAVKFISLHLKANNANGAPHLLPKRQARLTRFISECAIADRIKKCISSGSAIKAIRSIQSQESAPDEYSKIAVQFEELCQETPESLRHRFIV